jgi:hypothetical protein
MEASEFKKFSFVTIKTPDALGVAAMIALMGIVVFFGANQILEGKLEISPAAFALLFFCCVDGIGGFKFGGFLELA